MTAVDPVFAQWLQADGKWHVQDDAARKGRWGATALVTTRMTTLAEAADAEAEAARQLAFMGGPLVEDEHQLMGTWADCLGQIVTLDSERLGYAGGVDVFVIGAEDNRATGLSRVTVLRRL